MGVWIGFAFTLILLDVFVNPMYASLRAYVDTDRGGSTFVGRSIDDLFLWYRDIQKARCCRDFIVASHTDLVIKR